MTNTKLFALVTLNLVLAALSMPAHAQDIELPPIVITAPAPKPALRCELHWLEQGGNPHAQTVKVCTASKAQIHVWGVR